MNASTVRRFTDAEMAVVRSVDLPELLRSHGYEVKQVGSHHTTKEMDSLCIRNRRTWFRYSENVGGDAITLLQHFCGKSFPESVFTPKCRKNVEMAKIVPYKYSKP